MLGVDTNVLVRYLTRDDQSQYEKARRLIDREVAKAEPVLVSQLVLLETEPPHHIEKCDQCGLLALVRRPAHSLGAMQIVPLRRRQGKEVGYASYPFATSLPPGGMLCRYSSSVTFSSQSTPLPFRVSVTAI